MDINTFMALTKEDFEAMGLEDLEAFQKYASEFREQLKAQARVLVSVLDVKIERAKILRMFENLSNDQKKALVQSISEVGGIDSQESVIGL